MVRAKCDIHSWMGGYWVVAESPYTVLTDKDGNFSITDIPAGDYLGETTQKVSVTAGGNSEVKAALKI